MAYMIYQQYTTAIKNAYADSEECRENYEKAKACRQWLASLQIDNKLRAPLVEQITVIEEAFGSLLSKSKS